MATTTTNLGLTLPASGENWNLSTWNGNMGLIDTFAGPIIKSGYQSGVDANDYVHSGYYHVGISTNSPYGSSTFFGVLVVYEGADGHVQQMAISGVNAQVYVRGRNSSLNAFTGWIKLLINNDVTAKTTGSFSTTHTIDTENTSLVKSGNVVTLTLRLTLTSDVNSYGTIATVPSGFRPVSQQVYFNAEIGGFDVTSSGNIRVRDAKTSGTIIFASATYMI